jgi:hypothetical protein
VKQVVVLLALAGTVHAEPPLAIATAPEPERTPPVFVGVFGDYTHLSGIQAGGFGVDVELRMQRGRWQLFGEGAVAYLVVGATSSEQTGVQSRLGAGARWLARTFGDASSGFDLYIDGGVGATGFWWPTGHLARPDATLGWGFQVREHRISLRSGMRVLLTHDREGLAVLCRGCTMSPPETIDAGILFVMGMTW